MHMAQVADGGGGMTTTHSSYGIWGRVPPRNLRLLLRLFFGPIATCHYSDENILGALVRLILCMIAWGIDWVHVYNSLIHSAPVSFVLVTVRISTKDKETRLS